MDTVPSRRFFDQILFTRADLRVGRALLFRIGLALALFALVFLLLWLERDGLKEMGEAKGWRLPKDNPIQRYKGLGEMNYGELGETTMDPETRTLLQVSLDDAAKADEVFAVLMGEDVESRRTFIQKNARDVRFLDI